MESEKVVQCSWIVFHYFNDKIFPTSCNVSITDFNNIELMIFVSKAKTNEYEVEVYKNKIQNNYIPQEAQYLLKREDYDDHTSYFFGNFEAVHNFVDILIKHYIDATYPAKSQKCKILSHTKW